MDVGGQIKEKSKAFGLSNWMSFCAFYWDVRDSKEGIDELKGITRLVLDMLHLRCLFDLQEKVLSWQSATESGVQVVFADRNLSVIKGSIKSWDRMDHFGSEVGSEEIWRLSVRALQRLEVRGKLRGRTQPKETEKEWPVRWKNEEGVWNPRSPRRKCFWKNEIGGVVSCWTAR